MFDLEFNLSKSSKFVFLVTIFHAIASIVNIILCLSLGIIVEEDKLEIFIAAAVLIFVICGYFVLILFSHYSKYKHDEISQLVEIFQTQNQENVPNQNNSYGPVPQNNERENVVENLNPPSYTDCVKGKIVNKN
ncbi:hypothetical protein PVAND_017341 [Polypedilum vanderplanki]|uniref:Transmembrane protein n=1 Tax=Polypedilum vanderplanki TaxID=319348 RepID=A0A9J6BJ71_POLVA|nr:hypothetical protein PVAND_017341 [Polypedilum vanderplanki]